MTTNGRQEIAARKQRPPRPLQPAPLSKTYARSLRKKSRSSAMRTAVRQLHTLKEYQESRGKKLRLSDMKRNVSRDEADFSLK
jgi:hypothetical protein